MGTNNTLVCYIDMFSAAQSVLFPDGKEARVALNDIADYIPAVCYNHNIPKAHLFGNEEFINGLVQDIWAYEKTNYGKNNLEIEVN